MTNSIGWKMQMATPLVALLASFATAGATAQDIGGRVAQSGFLINIGSRLCADVAATGGREGGNVQLDECRAGRAEWDVVELGQNDFAFQNRATGQVLDVQNASRADGGNVQQWTWNRSDAQRWSVETVRGAYQIVNRGSGKCLEVQGRGNTIGANIAQYRCTGDDNQLWRVDTARGGAGTGNIRDDLRNALRGVLPVPITPAAPVTQDVRPAGRTLYTGMIHSRITGKCVDVEGASAADGADVRQWSCNGSNAQLWDVIDLGRNEVAFISNAGNKAMEAIGNVRQGNADVVQNRWMAIPTQRWRMEPIQGGFSRIVNVGSGKCLDLAAGGTTDGTNIIQYDCHVEPNQQWRIEIRGGNSGTGWGGYRPNPNWYAPNQQYQEEPPAYLVGDFKGYNNYFRSNIQLSIHTDGVVIATLDGGQKILGYYRGDQLFLGNARYDVEQERSGFRLRPTGQAGAPVSYVRARYDSPTRSR